MYGLDPMVLHDGKYIKDPDDETLEKMATDAAGKELWRELTGQMGTSSSPEGVGVSGGRYVKVWNMRVYAMEGHWGGSVANRWRGGREEVAGAQYRRWMASKKRVLTSAGNLQDPLPLGPLVPREPCHLSQLKAVKIEVKGYALVALGVG
ncbi:hypothetical protein ACJ72_02118 [Emergomyces africanus]|uniref:Uncharacterized protein n=1 Tax=Emergomyces africanus TaxID=1955775 RepID=A0A1B7P3C7_9EURO|nr:hypothetical protein ACJ72_02118 [Emergomyces africanus]